MHKHHSTWNFDTLKIILHVIYNESWDENIYIYTRKSAHYRQVEFTDHVFGAGVLRNALNKYSS